MNVVVRPTWIARLLGHSDVTVTGTAKGVCVESRGSSRQAVVSNIVEVRSARDWIWTTLRILEVDGTIHRVSGLRHTDAARMAVSIDLWRSHQSVVSLLAEFARPGGRDQYLTHSMGVKWVNDANKIGARATTLLVDPKLPAEPVSALRKYLSIVADMEAARRVRNDAYAKRQATRHAKFFQSGQGYSLNDRQIAAIVHDEDRCLVVAGAGTGKTSTIVGKAVHILAERLAKPREVLLLAFTRKAAEEMELRLKELTGTSVAVKTFHALGLQALAEATGKKPSLSKLAEDSKALGKAIEEFLTQLVHSGAHVAPMSEFLAFYRYPYREPSTFPTLHHYHQHIAGQDVRSLKGERLKSVEESSIANWLALHGIEYEYERNYEHDTASIQFRQYKPDFYLPGHGIYIEHFGINAQGQPPPFVADPQRYIEGMAWKRQLHKKHGTTLVESYSSEASDGTLLATLEKNLRALGVPISPLPPEGVRALLTSEEVLSPFTQIVTAFLNLYKGNAWTLDEVRSRIKASDDQRAAKFLGVFEPVLERYEDSLKAERAIDFNDMINTAVDQVAAGKFAPGYKYILVDEFQDISRGRARLVQALLAQVPDSKLFCVGDDWQSIYRFTGSDIDLMTGFAGHFGFTRRTDLQKTHRFGDKLLEASSRFVMSNPQQLRKQLLASHTSELPAVQVVSQNDQASKDTGLAEVLQRIAAADQSPRIDVLVLGRYHFLVADYKAVKSPDPRIGLRFMTVHAAKGLEADYAVILDIVGGRYGFPTEIVDDPLLDLVLAKKGSFPNAEERRLFYVALTRARIKSYVLTHDVKRSVFVDELEGREYAPFVIPSGAAARTIPCPICRGGRLDRKEGTWGFFWGCSNFPRCRATARVCPWCGVGAFVLAGKEYRCANKDCNQTAPVCPECGVGAVVQRDSRYGRFYGCTEWRSKGASCGYKRSAR